jgi:hypothetical protein
LNVVRFPDPLDWIPDPTLAGEYRIEKSLDGDAEFFECRSHEFILPCHLAIR